MKDIETETLEKLIEKMDGESAIAYSGFLFYAGLAPSERINNIALPKVAAYVGKAESTVEIWKKNYIWDERAESVDMFKFKLDFDEMREATRADREAYVQFNRDIKQGMMEELRKTVGVISVLTSYAQLIGEEKKTGEIETKDGRIVHQFTTVKMAAKVSDIAILANSVAKCAKAINELPTEIVENKIAINTDDLDNLPPDQLDALSENITKRMKELQAGVIMTEGVQ